MGIIYSGQTIINTTVDGSSNSALNAALRNVLVSAGWSVVQDGSSSGIWRLRSTTTPQGFSGDLWVRNAAGAGTALILNASSIAALNYNTALQSMSDCNLATGSGYTYQVIANPYYFYLLRAAMPCPAAQSFMMVIPYVPPFLASLITGVVLAAFGSPDPYEITKGLFTTAGSNSFSWLNGMGATGLKWEIYGVTTAVKPTWFDGSCEFYEPRAMSYQTKSDGTNVGTLQAVGYLWDALVLNYSMPRGSTISYDGCTWSVLTESTDPGLMVQVA